MAPLITSVVTSYDQKTKKLTSIKLTSIKIRAYGKIRFLSMSVGGYAQIKIFVSLILVNFFGFLVITRDHGSYEGRH